MYYNPYCGYWGTYPYMPTGGYPMGEAMEHYYSGGKSAPKDMKEHLLAIMQIQFALVELNLYLDTHPMEREAINQYNAYIKKYEELKESYEKKYGPLTAAVQSDCPWQYVQGPWPWEI